MLKVNKLDLVPTPELIDEVLKRFHSAVFIGLKPEQYAPDNYWYELKGCRLTCTGLVIELKAILDKARSDVVPIFKEEDPA